MKATVSCRVYWMLFLALLAGSSLLTQTDKQHQIKIEENNVALYIFLLAFDDNTWALISIDSRAIIVTD